MGAEDVSLTTRLLLRLGDRDPAAAEELLVHLYDELRSLAACHLSRERKNHTLQPTALVHEAYLRLVDAKVAGVTSRRHFLGIASRAMRQILVEHARARAARKRGGDRARVALDDVLRGYEESGVDILDLDQALERLAGLDFRKSRVVEMKFFGGLAAREIGEVLGISPKTVDADWYMARAWLRRELAV